MDIKRTSSTNYCLRKRCFVTANEMIYKIYLLLWCTRTWRVSDRFVLNKIPSFISWTDRTKKKKKEERKEHKQDLGKRDGWFRATFHAPPDVFVNASKNHSRGKLLRSVHRRVFFFSICRGFVLQKFVAKVYSISSVGRYAIKWITEYSQLQLIAKHWRMLTDRW